MDEVVRLLAQFNLKMEKKNIRALFNRRQHQRRQEGRGAGAGRPGVRVLLPLPPQDAHGGKTFQKVRKNNSR